MFSGLQRELNLWPLRYCQCSTNWAMKTHTLGAGQFIEFIVPVKGMKHISIMWTADIQMKWRCDHCSCDYDLSNRKLSWKSFWTFNGIWTCGLCLSAAVLHHLSYKDLYVGSRPIYWVHRPRERNETYQYYMNCGHTNMIIAVVIAALTQRPQVLIPLKPRRHFSGLICDCLNRNHNCHDHILTSFLSPQFT